MGRTRLRTISLFSGALGLDLGLEEAGFTPAVAVESNRFALDTIRKNRPKLAVVDRKIEEVTTAELLKAAGLEQGEAALVTAGPCCQAYSTAGQRASIEDPRGTLFREFLRVVKEARPRFFVMENVRGILSAAIRHRPLNERGPGFPPLTEQEMLGSAFALILEELRKTGYFVVFGLLNAADYGVPQRRERIIIVGSRDAEPFEMPTPTHSAKGSDRLLKWRTVREGLKNLKDPDPAYTKLPPSKSKFLNLIPEGGNWRDLPEDMQQEALGAAYVSWGGRSGFFRRLAWAKPAPSLTTKPDSKATMLCHPDELRPLSVREYARLQGFPDDWCFAGGTPQQYKQIGNAVPIRLGTVVGEAIRQTMRRRRKVASKKIVVCSDEMLLESLRKRPTTILNPQRMRKVQGTDEAKEWMNGASSGRGSLFEVALPEDVEYEIARTKSNRKRNGRS